MAVLPHFFFLPSFLPAASQRAMSVSSGTGCPPSHVCFLFVVSLTAQVASGGDDSHGQVEIFSLNRPTPRSVKSFSLGSPVLCLEYIPEPSTDEELETQSSEVPSKIGNTICVGLSDGK